MAAPGRSALLISCSFVDRIALFTLRNISTSCFEQESESTHTKVNEAKPRESKSGFAGGRNGGNAFGRSRNGFDSNGARSRTSFGNRDRTPRW